MATVQLVKRVNTDGIRAYKDADTKDEGVFYLTWYEKQGGKLSRKREALREGVTLNQAKKEQAEKQKDLDAIGRLKTNGTYTEPATPAERRTVADAATEYLAETKAHKSSKTYSAYAKSVQYFRESCTKTFIDAIERRDLLALKTFLAEEKGLSARSVSNQFCNVMAFLKYADRGGKAMGLTKNDWPQYDDDSMPETYTDAQLKKLFAACTPEERRWFKFFELTGMREGEVQHCQWSWIDLDKNTIKVQSNKRLDWRPKKNKSRQIPIPSELHQMLTEWRAKRDSTCDLVFPTLGCGIKLDFLDCLKAVAKRAGLFCGGCDGCTRKTAQNCEGIFLHKFRATYGTKVLRKTDVRTAMEFLGHTDMESTMRYLRPAEGSEAQAKIEAVFG